MMPHTENVQRSVYIAVMDRAAFVAHPLSGKEVALLPLPPLRTVLESFPSYGSSLYKSCFSLQNRQFIEFMLGVDLTMAVSVEQLQVVQRVTSPFCPMGDMVNHPFLV